MAGSLACAGGAQPSRSTAAAAVAWSRDASHVAVEGIDELLMLDTATGAAVLRRRVRGRAWGPQAFASDGSVLVIADARGRVLPIGLPSGGAMVLARGEDASAAWSALTVELEEEEDRAELRGRRRPWPKTVARDYAMFSRRGDARYRFGRKGSAHGRGLRKLLHLHKAVAGRGLVFETRRRYEPVTAVEAWCPECANWSRLTAPRSSCAVTLV